MNVPNATGRDAEQSLLYGKCCFQFLIFLNTFAHLGSLQTHCAFSTLDRAGMLAGRGRMWIKVQRPGPMDPRIAGLRLQVVYGLVWAKCGGGSPKPFPNFYPGVRVLSIKHVSSSIVPLQYISVSP